MSRDAMNFDVVIVGAGPAGLSTSIKLAQLAEKAGKSLEICIIDKADNIGAHSLSGAVLEPKALYELLPNWESLNPPEHTPVQSDSFQYLTASKAITLPTPPQMHNKGNFVISLSQYVTWLGEQAENLGVNVFPGFAATEILFDGDRIVGIVTGDKGLNRFGEEKENYQPGMELRAKQVVFAEGCRGSLTESLFTRFKELRENADPQTYGLGIKEVWEIPEELFEKGKVVHTIGWPLDHKTYGGSFAYHFGKNLLSIGFVVGLDYENPYLSPYEEFQRFKTHPNVKPLLENSKRIAYGARTLVEGGIQSLPKLTLKGGLIVGDAAGFLNVPKIKGINNAIKSGILAAEAIFNQFDAEECTSYSKNFEESWLKEDLHKARNIRPSFKYGLIPAILYSGLDTYVFRGKAPWTFHHHKTDRVSTKKASLCKKIEYPKHDNKITFDITTSVFLANVQYDEDQPYHLKLADKKSVPIDINFKEYASPETRYCPAGVYEIVYNEDNMPRIQVNGGNCIHCKACDIKDPTKNIKWTPSEGGSGPQYTIT